MWRIMILLTLGLLSVGTATARDLHAYWDDRCAGCHGHAADFSRQFLTVENGALKGRHHRNDLALFLANHYIDDALIEPVMAMLAAQKQAMPRFKAQCQRCHATAADLARESLAVRDGELVSRTTGQPMRDYLKGHGRIKAADQPAYLDFLARITREVGAGE